MTRPSPKALYRQLILAYKDMCNVLARCLQFDLVKGCWIRDAEEEISASRVKIYLSGLVKTETSSPSAKS